MPESVLVTSRGLVQIAGLIWFLYDYFLTLDDEVEHIWFKKLNLSTLFYISSRVLSFVMLVVGAVEATRTYELTMGQCTIFHWFEGVGTMVIFVNTQLVLQYRIWAIYNRCRKILIMNGVLFILETVGAIVFCSIFYGRQKHADISPPTATISGPACVTVPQREMSLIFCGVLAFELWLVVLAVFQTLQTHRLLAASGHRTITQVIAYDSVAYFVLITLSCLVVILVWFFAPVYPGNATVAFTRAAGGIGACRLILHVKREGRARDEHSLSVGVSLDLAGACFVKARGISPIKFACVPPSPTFTPPSTWDSTATSSVISTLHLSPAASSVALPSATVLGGHLGV